MGFSLDSGPRACPGATVKCVGACAVTETAKLYLTTVTTGLGLSRNLGSNRRSHLARSTSRDAASTCVVRYDPDVAGSELAVTP